MRPPVPVEEYLREQKERQLQQQAGIDNQSETRKIRSANAITPQQQQFWPQQQQPSIRDLDSLRTLLPTAHQHLLGNDYNR